MHGRGKGFAHRPLLQGNLIGEPEELVRAGNDVSREPPVHSVSHAAPSLAKHKFPVTTVDTMPAGNSRRSQNTELLADANSANVFADLDAHSRDFVSQNHGGKVAKSIVIDVQVGAAKSTPSNFKFHLAGAADGLLDLAQFHVAWTFRELY